MGFVNAGEAYFAHDGKTIIFQATPTGKTDYQIYTLNLRTRRLKIVSTGRGACTCAFFRPDGKKIIFASSHLGPGYGELNHDDTSDNYQWHFNEHMDIFGADLDGSNLRRLTDAPGYDAEAAYSPDAGGSSSPLSERATLRSTSWTPTADTSDDSPTGTGTTVVLSSLLMAKPSFTAVTDATMTK